MKTYQIGEIVLMELNGWLKACRVVGVEQISEHEIQYKLELVQAVEGPQWKRPARG